MMKKLNNWFNYSIVNDHVHVRLFRLSEYIHRKNMGAGLDYHLFSEMILSLKTLADMNPTVISDLCLRPPHFTSIT